MAFFSENVRLFICFYNGIGCFAFSRAFMLRIGLVSSFGVLFELFKLLEQFFSLVVSRGFETAVFPFLAKSFDSLIIVFIFYVTHALAFGDVVCSARVWEVSLRLSDLIRRLTCRVIYAVCKGSIKLLSKAWLTIHGLAENVTWFLGGLFFIILHPGTKISWLKVECLS